MSDTFSRFSVEQHVCHIIDFGLAKKYQDPRTGRHIVYLEVRNFPHSARARVLLLNFL
jgi:hypothetical protein